jgi:hypothetical protein
MNALSTGQTLVAKKESKQAEKPRETTVEFLASLSAVLVTGLFIITFIVQAFEIPSSSMENTLLIGDHVAIPLAVHYRRERDRSLCHRRLIGPLPMMLVSLHQTARDNEAAN